MTASFKDKAPLAAAFDVYILRKRSPPWAWYHYIKLLRMRISDWWTPLIGKIALDTIPEVTGKLAHVTRRSRSL
jgi:hypothetical protein